MQGGKYVVIASSSLSRIGSKADPDDILPIKTQQTNIIEKVVDNFSFLEIQAPLYEDGVPVASVGLYLDINQAKKEVHAHILEDILLGVFALLGSLVIYYFYFRTFLIKPIISLQQAIGEMAKGNLNTVAPLHHRDELGEITQAFNLMAKKLQETQVKLLELERVKAAAQIAGTAAHELNQPLATISIHCEMLLRNLPSEDPRQEQLNTILGQTERMAKIIRMMTEITDYQTQPYLGQTDIIDLEKSSEKKKEE